MEPKSPWLEAKTYLAIIVPALAIALASGFINADDSTTLTGLLGQVVTSSIQLVVALAGIVAWASAKFHPKQPDAPPVEPQVSVIHDPSLGTEDTPTSGWK